MTKALDPKAKRLRKLTDGQLADEVGQLEARIDALKAQANCRDLHRAEGTLFRITLTPPGTQQRTDKPLLLRALGVSADEFATRFCRTVHPSWRLTCTPLRKLAAAA
jgi:hypothetical protein